MVSASLFRKLERRARRVSGSRWASWAWAGAALVAVIALAAARLWLPALFAPARTALYAAPAAAALVAYALGRRPRPYLPGLLLTVDERLGLEARLSTLYELSRHPGPASFQERIAADVARRAPAWRRGIPVGRLPFALALSGAVLIAAGAALVPSPRAPLPVASDPGESAPMAQPAPAAQGPSPAGEGSAVADTQGPSAQAPALPGRPGALRDILAELRPAGSTADAASSGEAEREGSDSELRRDLERLSERLNTAPSPLSAVEQQTVHNFVAAEAPARRAEVDAALAASDLDALRQTIRQLLSEAGPDEKDEEAPSVARLAPDTSSEPPPQGTPPAASPGGVPPAPGANGAGPGTQGDGSAPSQSSVTPPPVFETPEVGVRPVTPPSALGSRGGYSEYLTAGVPVEPPQEGSAAVADMTFRFDRIESVLSGRDVPDSAVDTIRTYFERITEENP